ncbi:9809_t:CDS:2 [Diversispora eburnea]|uniref:Glutamine synthetase n=1 Tax=Diversispora eburnea TaxID=1213867 RepID=A0A9N8YV98_9GLOM|nr:9809_t:CDS:2 [Diversispora eburnea]
MGSYEKLFKTVASFPLIDNHAHNLSTSDAFLAYPLEGCFSEARGDALKDATQTSALKCGVQQLSKLYKCAPVWRTIKDVRNTLSYDELCKICFENIGIQCVLLDDGFGISEHLRDIKSHVGLVDDVRRIVRIESVAENILYNLAESIVHTDEEVKINFSTLLKNELRSLANSELVVAFKSIAAYRSGLNINCDINNEKIVIALSEHLKASTVSPVKNIAFKLFDKTLIDYILNYPNAKIILLHAAYPYSRQAGYLASVYANIYVDIGLVAPLISVSGQQAILRELVLLNSVENGDFTIDEAVNIAKQIMFESSNKLYKLNLEPKILSEIDYFARGISDEKKMLMLKENGVKLVRLGYLDLSNQFRIRLIPIDRFQNYITKLGLTASRAINIMPLFGDHIPEGIGITPAGECLLKPDFNTLIQLPYYPQHAIAHAFLENKWTPGDPKYGKLNLIEDDKYYSICPRNCLRKIVDMARQDFGLGFLTGVESEFTLLTSKDSRTPVDETVYCAAESFRHNNSVEIIDKIIDSLLKSNIPVEQCHSESTSGQYELVTGPSSPLIAMDNCVITRNTIYDIAAKEGLRATFVAKPYKDQAGSGAHLHISVHEINQIERKGEDETGLTSYERSFIAGVLHHIKSICAFSLTTSNSYTRTVDHCWAGSWIFWGVENREAPVRICYRPKKNSVTGKLSTSYEVNFEHKFVDGFSNPYLVASAILAAGLDGIKKKMELKTPSCLDDPALLTEKERTELGITERMPSSLRETLDALKQDTVLIKAMGEELVKCYIGIKESELSHFEHLTDDEQLSLLIKRF